MVQICGHNVRAAMGLLLKAVSKPSSRAALVAKTQPKPFWKDKGKATSLPPAFLSRSLGEGP